MAKLCPLLSTGKNTRLERPAIKTLLLKQSCFPELSLKHVFIFGLGCFVGTKVSVCDQQ